MLLNTPTIGISNLLLGTTINIKDPSNLTTRSHEISKNKKETYYCKNKYVLHFA